MNECKRPEQLKQDAMEEEVEGKRDGGRWNEEEEEERP